MDFVTVSYHSAFSIKSFFPDLKFDTNKVFYSPSTITESVEDGEKKGENYFLLVSGNRWEKNNLRALIALDELYSEGMLKNYRMNVKTADSGKKAVRLCENADFDLVFLDHMMPEMDGVETLKQLRKLNADSGRPLTIIAFTANAVSGAREMFLREGFDEFISKPIELFELEIKK